MNSQQRWERAAAIATRFRELVAEMEQLPKVPIVVFLPAEMRRKFRRFAARLRAGKVEPRYPNLFTAEELADICEQAAYRDEFLENAVKELHQLEAELRALLDENEAERAKETMAELLPVKDAAQWLGPDSQAEQRYREIQRIRRQGQRLRNRPRKAGPPEPMELPGMDFELHVRQWVSAAETLLEGAPAGERVLHFPEGAGDDRIVLRIGIAESSWVGSFQRGATDFTTVQLMPDNRNLLVVAGGAGYIVEAISNSLVACLEHDIVSVICHEPSPLLVVDHGGTRLEAFGPGGRMWRTGAIACGGFREFGVADGVMSFEACQTDGEWLEVVIDVGTGEQLSEAVDEDVSSTG